MITETSIAKESMQDYISRYKHTYKQISSFNCKVINSEIYFTMPGFKHLIYKNNRRRPNIVIKSRLKLIPLAIPVLKNITKISETRTNNEFHHGKKCTVTYHAFESIVSKSKILVRVIVRIIGENGKPHFFSIMRY